MQKRHIRVCSTAMTVSYLPACVWILYFIILNNNAYKMLTKIIPPSWDI